MKTSTFEKKAANKNGILRVSFIGLALLIEISLVVLLFLRINRVADWVNIITRTISVVLVLVIYAMEKTSTMKMPWIILIMGFPVLGIILFLAVGLDGTPRKMRKRYEKVNAEITKYYPDDKKLLQKFKESDPQFSSVSTYLNRHANAPIYKNTRVTYYSDASKALERMLEEIQRAKNFIFMEYFAIDGCSAWQRIEEALVKKVSEGVIVRVFYDDIGSIGYINTSFAKRLEKRGIECRPFNPANPFVNMFINNRDHRKLTVIDGKVGFTGGFNLADEYFNITHPYGMWKDTGICLEGEAVKSLTAMLLEMWNATKKSVGIEKDIEKYMTCAESEIQEDYYVQPYADSPLDKERVGEEVYISILNKAVDYCYFITPYLIITDEMVHAMNLASKRGVDVRIITPGIPDKRLVYSLTRSFYHCLVKDGIRIYEWTPGFVHAKMCVSDGKVATIGTINLDYRSLYHHFETATFISGGPVVGAIKEDFDKTFTECKEVTEKYLTGRSSMLRVGQMLLRLFAELL